MIFDDNFTSDIKKSNLILRPLDISDAPTIQHFASDFEVARTTAAIPHPYPDGGAVAFLANCKQETKAGLLCNRAVVLKSTNAFIGIVGLMLKIEHGRADLGYWIAKPFWNQGYGTEAARLIFEHGFNGLGLNRISANALAENEASWRIMEKIGMRREGVLRQHVTRFGVTSDMVCYGILKSEFVNN